MEVTHYTDYNTHAVLGGGEAEAFGIENNAQFVTMLSSTLYSNAFLAVIREITCNAWDAHKDKGIRDTPIQITLNQDELIIRDFGKGIPHDKMTRTYCVYGGTTKKEDENQTGGFGLGSKAPFAYSDYFTVVNRHEGVQRVYAISRGNADTKGMPDARVIVEFPTDETGISVQLPIKDHADVKEFDKWIRSIVFFGEMNVELNGSKLPTISLSQSEERLILTRHTPPSVNGRIYVRYGNVVYPVETSREYDNLYATVHEMVEEAMNTSNSYGGWDRSNQPFFLIFDASPNSISVTPSRESLHMSERTIQTVQGLLENFINTTREIDIATMMTTQENIIFNMFRKMPDADIRELMYDDNIIRKYLMKANGWDAKANVMHFHRIYDFILFKVAHGHYNQQAATTQEQRLKVMDLILENDPFDADLLRKLKTILKENGYTRTNRVYWRAFKHYTGIIRRMVAKGLDPKRLYWWKPNSYAGRKQFAGDLLIESPMGLDDIMALSSRVIYYCTAKTHMTNWENHSIPGFDEYKNPRGVLLYIDPRKATNHDANVEFFKKLGYITIDMWSKYKPKPVTITALPKAKVKAPPAKKYKGWPKLTDMIGLNSLVDPTLVRYGNKEMMERTTKPLFYIKPRNLNGDYPSLFVWGTSEQYKFLKYFGNDGAVSLSLTQNMAMRKVGAVDGEEYIVNAVCDYMVNNTIFKDRNLFSILTGNMPIDIETLESVAKHVVDLKDFPFTIPAMTEEQEHYSDMFDTLWNMQTRLRPDMAQRVRDTFAAISPEVNKDTPNPYRAFLPDDIRNRTRIVSVDELLEDLDNDELDVEKHVWAKTILTLVFMK